MLIESIRNLSQISNVIRRYGYEMNLVIIGAGDSTLDAAIVDLVDIQRLLGIFP